LTYFFAPKIRAADLPGNESIEKEKKVYIQRCGQCHLLIAPDFYRHNVTIEIILLRYLQQKIINEDEARAIRDYILAVTADS